MSQVMQHSRGTLYEKYKESKPQIAKQLLGDNSSSLALLSGGGAVLASAILTSMMFISILASVTNGFGPMPNKDFYPSIESILGGIGGGFAALGIVMLAIGYCKRQHVLAEQLSVTEINRIAGEILIDPTKGFRDL